MTACEVGVLVFENTLFAHVPKGQDYLSLGHGIKFFSKIDGS